MRSLLFVFSLIALPGITGLQAQSTENGPLAVYSDQYQGRPTASGELYDRHALTAAHATLPFGSIIRVANFETGRMVDVRVNDRKGMDGRILNLSGAAAHRIGLPSHIVAPGSLMLIGQSSGVQPVASTSPPRPVPGNDLGAMYRPTPPGADPQPQRFKSFSGMGKKKAINDAVAGSGQVAEQKKGGGLFNREKSPQNGTPEVQSQPQGQKSGGIGSFFDRFKTSSKAEAYVNSSAPPSAAYPPSALGSPGSPSEAHLTPMNATIPSAPSAIPPSNAAPQAPAPSAYPYRAQFGAFQADVNARELSNSLNSSGVGATVLRSPATGLYLVVTGGGFKTAEDAQQWINNEVVRRNWKDRPVVVR